MLSIHPSSFTPDIPGEIVNVPIEDVSWGHIENSGFAG